MRRAQLGFWCTAWTLLVLVLLPVAVCRRRVGWLWYEYTWAIQAELILHD